MGGGIIVILTLMAIGFILLLIWLSFRLMAALNSLFLETEGRWLAKILLFIPYVFVAVWCFFIQIFLLIVTFGAVATTATSMRNWWHKGS